MFLQQIHGGQLADPRGTGAVPECAEVRLPQNQWRLSGCAGRGWSSLEIPAEESVYVVPVGEKRAGSHGGSQRCPVRTMPLGSTVALSDKMCSLGDKGINETFIQNDPEKQLK